MNILQFNLILFVARSKGFTLSKMAKVSMDVIKTNAELTKQVITTLKSELKVLNEEYNTLRAKQLREENAKLMAALEVAKAQLIKAEIANGVPQIAIPGQNVVACIEAQMPSSDSKNQKNTANIQEQTKAGKVEKPKKDKKPKEAQPATEAPVDIGRLDLRVAKVLEVQRHPDADTLYLLKINCGDEQPRTVCSGLVKHVPIDELKERSVMLLCNLKPVKMRGIMSEAMVMCASTPDKVEVLLPPPGSCPGDLVECEGFERAPDAVLNPKKKIFETVALDLHTNDNLEACYKGVPLRVAGKGILAATLKNVAVK